MGLLDLVEQDHAVRPPAHPLGELAALVVADVARRRTDQPGHRVALHVFAHVDADHRVFVAEHHLGQGLGQLGLAHPGRAEEQEGGDRPAALAQPGAGQAHGVADRGDRFLLADHPLVQALFHLQELLALLGGQFGDRDAGELGDDLGDVLDPHLLGLRPLGLLPALGDLLEVFLAFLDAFLEDLRLVVPLAAGGVVLLALELRQLGLQFLDLGRPRGAGDAHAGGGLVDQVDGLVRQEAVADVAVGQLGGGGEGLVADGHLVVAFELVAQATEDGDGLLHRRLGDEHRLEAPLQRGVLLDVLLVLVEGGGADQVHLATRHRRLQHVGHVQPAFAAALAGTNDGVHLVDEQDDLALRRLQFVHHLLEAFLELTAVLGAGDHGVDVQFDQALVAQHLRHLALDHALGQAFDDGGLADAGLADQHRVVLLAPGENLDGGLDFLRAADHRIELAFAGQPGQVAAELVQLRSVARAVHAAVLGALADHLDRFLP